ncbi:prepilin-type N-terminal cleavage/methylation domain-containing protein [Deinococcus cavernae]|uniref:Prepilin-type N-terminal cleavage/methylation domain-containing protein n=1 Tax=Deinococcus cavernae TaxID=2320857 RepID=A0A418V9N6_9DEIO|nr:prepilin-type N-terminal cleavage/methylation domain-containing protein [Deinococcus cavernae]RJF72803.1 prepilin-type N-terminal cleavage/methylation domain-containing protein [Deinococcus cavernae]
MKGNRKGLTLVELLVGMTLMGIILTALVSFFTQSSKTSMQSSARADLQQETLNAQQLIAGKLKEAWYVYPVVLQV